jgi:hypothetical protein
MMQEYEQRIVFVRAEYVGGKSINEYRCHKMPKKAHIYSEKNWLCLYVRIATNFSSSAMAANDNEKILHGVSKNGHEGNMANA